MHFVVIGPIENRRQLAAGASVRIRRHLTEKFGPGRWRKMADEAMIQLGDGRIVRAEVHWFEAHGIGRVYFKRKGREGPPS